MPLGSRTTLAKGPGLAVKNTIRLLEGVVTTGATVEVALRAKPRRFGLASPAPIASVVRPPDDHIASHVGRWNGLKRQHSVLRRAVAEPSGGRFAEPT
jgi:hypothetical protein